MFDAREEAKALQEFAPFPWIGMDGQTYEFPPVNSLTQGQLMQFRSGDLELFADILDEDTYQALMALPLGVANKLGTAWVEAAGEAGKEPLPSSRRPATAKRSPRTSRRAG